MNCNTVINMKKTIIFAMAFCFLQCIGNNNKEAAADNLYKSVQIEDSTAILKNNKAVDIYLKSNGNIDSLRKAIDLLDEALNIDPNYAIAYTNKAQYLSVLGEYDEVMVVIDQALKVRPDDPQLHFIKGVFYEKENLKKQAKKSFEEAILSYDKAIDSNPKDFNLLANQAFIRVFTEDSISAIESLEALKDKQSKDSKEYKELDSLINLILDINREEYIKNFWEQ